MTTLKRLVALAALLVAIAGSGNASADALCARLATDIPVQAEVQTCVPLP